MTLVCSNPQCASHEQPAETRSFEVNLIVDAHFKPMVSVRQIPNSLFKCECCKKQAKPYKGERWVKENEA